MRRLRWAMMVGVAGTLAACGGSKAPPQSPASDSEPAADAASDARIESGTMSTSDGDAAETPVEKQELPCPGKSARYWDTGLVKSEVLTSDCEVNGQTFSAGTRLEFDEDGQLVPTE